MAADAAIINALTTAEYAKNVPDYSKIFEMSYGGVDAIMKGTLSAVESISTAVSEKNKLEAEKQKVIAEDLKAWKEGVLNNFDTSANEFYKQIATREEGGKEAGMNPGMKNYAWEYMEDVRGELEDLVSQPKTRDTAKGIMDLESKAQTFIDGLVGMRGDLLTFAQQAGSSNSESSVNKEATLAWDGGNGMQMASRLFKLDEEGWKGITPGMDEKGMFVNMDRQAFLSKEELIAKGYNEFTADELIKYGHNTEVVTEKLYASDLSKLVQWKDEEGSTAIKTEVTTGAEMADTDDIKTRVALGDLTFDETTGQWKGKDGNPIFDFEGVQDNIAKNIRTSDSGDKKENLYDMIYREFRGQGSSYAESTKNHPVIKTARYNGIAVSSLVQDLPADADGDGDVELTSDGSGGWVDESGNAVLDTDWKELQGKLLKPRTQEEKDAVAEDIAWYFAKQSEGKFNEKVDLLNRVKVRNDEIAAATAKEEVNKNITPPTTFELWGKTVPIPTTATQKEELANVQGISTGRSIIKIGDEQYRYDEKSDGYLQEYAIIGDKRQKITDWESGTVIPKEDLIMMASKMYGDISSGYLTGSTEELESALFGSTSDPLAGFGTIKGSKPPVTKAEETTETKKKANKQDKGGSSAKFREYKSFVETILKEENTKYRNFALKHLEEEFKEGKITEEEFNELIKPLK